MPLATVVVSGAKPSVSSLVVSVGEVSSRLTSVSTTSMPATSVPGTLVPAGDRELDTLQPDTNNDSDVASEATAACVNRANDLIL